MSPAVLLSVFGVMSSGVETSRQNSFLSQAASS